MFKGGPALDGTSCSLGEEVGYCATGECLLGEMLSDDDDVDDTLETRSSEAGGILLNITFKK